MQVPRHASALVVAVAALVVVGGIARSAPADDNRWQLLRPGGQAPPALRWASHTVDVGRNQLLVFAGLDATDETNELWILDLVSEEWSLVRPRGTAPYYRYQAPMAFDAAGDRAVVFGGYYYDSERDRPVLYDDTWFLELGEASGPEWVKLPFGPVKPSPRRAASMVYQPDEAGPGRMVLFGGYDIVNGRAFDDVWALEFDKGSEAWTEIGASCATKPSPRDSHVAVYDPRGRRMIVFGGWLRTRSTDRTLDDVWSFDLSGRGGCWQQIQPPPPGPPSLAWSTAVLDTCPTSPRIVTFGGVTGWMTSSNARLDDTNEPWVLALDLPGFESWAQLDPGGSRPRPRDAHVAAYDPIGRRMVVFSGWENEGELMRDVWALEFGPCVAPTGTATVPVEPTATSPPTASSSATVTAAPTDGPTASVTDSPTGTTTSVGPPSVTPDVAGTSVAGTLTALAPTEPATDTPDAVGTSVAGTLTASAPSPAASPTASRTPDAFQTSVAATLTAIAAPEPSVFLPLAMRRVAILTGRP
jgi:hypothetical protein